MNSHLSQIAIASLITFLVILLEHLLPWQALLKRPLPLLVRYIMGVGAINLMLTTLFWMWGLGWVILALWVVTIFAGLATSLAYWMDHTIEAVNRMIAAEADALSLRKEVVDDARDAKA